MQYHRNKSKLKVFTKNGKYFYICLVRNQKIQKTPEEEIRQLLLYHLINEKQVPIENIWVEGALTSVFSDITHKGRFDIMIYEDKKVKKSDIREIIALFECKKAGGNLELADNQIYDYNRELGAIFSVITNGKETFIEYVNLKKDRIELLTDLPMFKDMKKFKTGGFEVAYFDKKGKVQPIK